MSAEPLRTVVAIDPGSEKCGVAVVREDGVTLVKQVTHTESILGVAQDFLTRYEACALVCGAGTSSKGLRRTLEEVELLVPVRFVPETNTTLTARVRYLKEHPARGWRRLLPPSLRTPEEPVDDYVAVLLGERFWLDAPL
jgi:RNase H-fold protein (predicted Holliday junction resolvase)